MATRQQIDRLAQRIDRLAEGVTPRWPKRWVTIHQQKHQGETEDEASAKYFARFPEHQGAGIILMVIV